MNNFQRIVNLLAIIAGLYCLYNLSGNINQKYANYVDYNQIVKAISQNDAISETMIQQISTLAQSEDSSQLQKTPLCFLKAYHSIVIEEKIDSKGLFYLFELSQHQYINVDSCSNYYSVLLFRAKALEVELRNKVLTVLEKLQNDEIKRQYREKKDSQNICVYFSIFNNQKSIKSQIAALSTQSHKNFKVLIEDRGSTDNTFIISSYQLNQLYKNTSAKIQINKMKDGKGPIFGLQNFVENCEESSIILVIAQNETLIGNNALQIVSRVFSNFKLDFAVFSSLSQGHLNLQSARSLKELSNVTSPVVAFRKQALVEKEKLLKIEEEPKLQQFWRNWLTRHLIYLGGKSNHGALIIKQAIVSNSMKSSNIETVDVETLQKYNSLI